LGSGKEEIDGAEVAGEISGLEEERKEAEWNGTSEEDRAGIKELGRLARVQEACQLNPSEGDEDDVDMEVEAPGESSTMRE
jgi:hypothetical protein